MSGRPHCRSEGRGFAPKMPPGEPVWSCAARLSAGPAPHPESRPQALSQAFPPFSHKRPLQEAKAQSSKRPEVQVAWSSLLGFRGSSSFSYRSRVTWFKIPIKAAMLISYIGSYFLITVPKENLGRRREKPALPPSFVHLNKVRLKSTPCTFAWNTPSFREHF